MNDSPFITVKQLAQRWQISTRSVCEMLLAGEIKGFKLRNEWRISLASVVEYEERPQNCNDIEATLRQYAAGAVVKRIT